MNKKYSGKDSHRNNSYKGKGRKPGKKGSYSKMIEESESKDSKSNGDINDPSYYYGDATVLGQVMNFSFNQFGGVILDHGPINGTPQTVSNPLVTAIALNPSVPRTQGTGAGARGATIAALRNYLALSGSNAKTTTYAPQDVFILELAIGEIIKISTFLSRALGIAYLFNYRNRTYPETLLKAMGINDVDFVNNLAIYRVRYNKLLALASKIPFPAAIPGFHKAANVFSSLYLDDANSALAQTYMFVPKTTWLFDEAYDTNGSGLRTLPFADPASPRIFNQMLNDFESMISALLNSTTLNAIYSDVLRLVQSGKITQLITFLPIDESFTVIPVYNEEIKNWMHNAYIAGNPLPAASQYGSGYTPDNDLSSDAGSNTILYNPQFAYNNDFGFNALLDFDTDQVTTEMKVEATRLSFRCQTRQNPNDGNYYTTDIAVLDLYITGMYFFDGIAAAPGQIAYSAIDDTVYTIGQIVNINHMLSKFDWAPLIYAINPNTTDGWDAIWGDLDYYTFADFNLLKQMYDYEVIHFWQIG